MTDTDRELFQKDEIFHGYRIVRLLGQGGVGAVYLVRHEVLDTFYALKVLFPSAVAKDAMQIKRFLREARLSTHVRHPNLVTVHDCGHDTEKDVYYLIMDYISGNTLRSILAFEGALPVPRAADIVAQVVQALKAAQHYHVVHRDIKPENIMVQGDGCVKLVDLGIAKARDLGDSVQTKTDSAFGTPAYVSPEQALDAASVDARADIYSLGIVFYEMLTGECPYQGRNAADILVKILSEEPLPDIRARCPEVAPEVALLIRQMTEKTLDRRMGSFDEILAALERIGCRRTPSDEGSAEVAARPEAGMNTLLEGIMTRPLADAKPASSKGLCARLFGWLGKGGKR